MPRIINRARNSSIAIMAVGRGAHNLGARRPDCGEFWPGTKPLAVKATARQISPSVFPVVWHT
jgi:hypothetical protein